MITPNMSMDLPTPTVTPGPEWAGQLNAALTLVDGHDHTTGKGQRVPTAGLNINADLSINSNNLNLIRSARLTPETAILATPNDIRAIYSVNGDLYYNNASGIAVQITNGSVVTAASDGISRAYQLANVISTPTAIGPASLISLFAINTTTAKTLNLPSAAAVAPGRFFIMKDITGQALVNNISIVPSGLDTINGGAGTYFIATPNASISFTSDGVSNWYTTGGEAVQGVLPLGSILATFPNLTGAYTTAATTIADSNGFVRCNGQTISDVTSPMNGAVIPNINNSVFLMGSTTAGTSGGSNNVVIPLSALPGHTHGAGSYATSLSGTFASTGHTHGSSNLIALWGYTGGNIWGYSPRTVPSYTATGTGADLAVFGTRTTTEGTGIIGSTDGPSATSSLGGSNSVTGTSSSTGAGSGFDARPAYISTVYLMRIK